MPGSRHKNPLPQSLLDYRLSLQQKLWDQKASKGKIPSKKKTILRPRQTSLVDCWATDTLNKSFKISFTCLLWVRQYQDTDWNVFVIFRQNHVWTIFLKLFIICKQYSNKSLMLQTVSNFILASIPSLINFSDKVKTNVSYPSHATGLYLKDYCHSNSSMTRKTLWWSEALGVHIRKADAEQGVFILHSQTQKHMKTCGGPARFSVVSWSRSLLWHQESKGRIKP